MGCFLLTGLAAMAAFFVSPLTAGPVIDDVALEKSFIEGLRRPGVDGLDGEAAVKALHEAEGKRIGDSGVGEPAFDYEAVCRAVVVVGSISHCHKCNAFHMDSVSTGWISDPAGRVVTNHHVLADKEAGELGVMTMEGVVYPVRTVLAADREGDAAVLGIQTGGDILPALRLASEAKTGEKVRVLGHPDGRFYSLTEGIVSRVFAESTEDGKDRRNWVSITADYGAGSSGAPVLNSAGEVIGMVSSTAALLAYGQEDKEPGADDLQMVFRDCVSIDTIRRLIKE